MPKVLVLQPDNARALLLAIHAFLTEKMPRGAEIISSLEEVFSVPPTPPSVVEWLSAKALPSFYKRLLRSYMSWVESPKVPGKQLKPVRVKVDIAELLAMTYCIPNSKDTPNELLIALGCVDQSLTSSSHMIGQAL